MDQGLTCPAQYDKTIKRLEINNSKRRILLITSQKFDTIKSTAFASWDEIDQVITDSGIPDRWKKFLSDKGIEVKIV